MRGDVAWGGNWFFITAQAPCTVELANQRALTAYTEAIRVALEQAGIRGQDGEIDHIEVNATAPDGSGQMRNFVLCPGLAYDRSPCGTGTSAKLACLAEDGKLKSGESWRQASIIGSEFTAHFVPHGDKIVPTIFGMVPFLDPGCQWFEESDQHGYTVFHRDLETHRKALTSPRWRDGLETDGQYYLGVRAGSDSAREGLELRFSHHFAFLISTYSTSCPGVMPRAVDSGKPSISAHSSEHSRPVSLIGRRRTCCVSKSQ